MKRLAAAVAALSLAGCTSTDIAIEYPPNPTEKSVRVSMSGTGPLESAETVRDKVCEAVLASCGPEYEKSTENLSPSDIWKVIDKFPTHSFTWSGPCSKATTDCATPRS